MICGHSLLRKDCYLFLAFRVIPPVITVIVIKMCLDISSSHLITQKFLLFFFPVLGTRDKMMSKIYMGFAQGLWANGDGAKDKNINMDMFL